jgi:T-complex protein 1 subunit beta
MHNSNRCWCEHCVLPQVGDGTTSVTVLCGELLREAEQLVNARLHPQTIIQGWRLATAIARKVQRC